MHHCVLEATGNYGSLLVEMLVSAEIAVSVVNPRQIKHFSKAMHHITKTDKVDAQLIALYGSKNAILFNSQQHTFFKLIALTGQ